jgi:hypothetical protein
MPFATQPLVPKAKLLESRIERWARSSASRQDGTVETLRSFSTAALVATARGVAVIYPAHRAISVSVSGIIDVFDSRLTEYE